jgi:hypothetical protein
MISNIALCLLLVVVPGLSQDSDDGPIRGFLSQTASAQRGWEAKFRLYPNSGKLQDYMKRLSARPHHVGSPYLEFAPLQNGVDALTRSAEHYEKAFAGAGANGGQALTQAHSANPVLIESESRLTDPQGLPDRLWFQHQIYAPGFYTGYGVKTLPGIREAIEQAKWQEANAQIVRVGRVLSDEAALLESAAAILEHAAR